MTDFAPKLDLSDSQLCEALLELPKMQLAAALASLPRPVLAKALSDVGAAVQGAGQRAGGELAAQEQTTSDRPARRQAMNSATAIFDNWTRSADCFIQNRSGEGFLIQARDTATLPETFHLSVPSEDMTYPVRVAWRKGEQMGLAIIGG